ncbi:MAG: hypothetical protein EXR75_04010 [Myxococcales bacterium]|nr:hypothetical protein [Myxococcales bacterium]
MRRVLAIGAHFDDIEIGCGGALLAWRARGDEIAFFVATESSYRDPNGTLIRTSETAQKEGRAAAALAGAALIEAGLPTFEVMADERLHRPLLHAIAKFAPDVVLSHWVGDPHRDHREVALATLHCARKIPRVLAYRSNWDPSAQAFDPRFYVNIESTLDGKLALVRTHVSEHKRTDGIWEERVRATAADAGARSGCTHAEAFEVIRWLD